MTNKSEDYYNEVSDLIILALDGKETVRNGLNVDCGSNVTIEGGTGNDELSNTGEKNIKIFGGAGNDSIRNDGSKIKISGGDGNDTIDSYGDKVKIFGNVGNDSVSSYGNNVTVDGGTGNDIISVAGDENIKIYGGAGDDSIESDGYENITISGGAGNDSINVNSNESTIIGGKGNDLISLNAQYVQSSFIRYASGDGNDTISGFDSDDVLHITKGSYKVTTKGKNVIVTVGKGKITLKDAVGEKISIKNSKGKVTTKTYGKTSSALLAENDFLKSNNLSEIVKNNLSPTDYKIEAQNFESLTQQKDFITFADK